MKMRWFDKVFMGLCLGLLYLLEWASPDERRRRPKSHQKFVDREEERKRRRAAW